jgi:hypothetical protein
MFADSHVKPWLNFVAVVGKILLRGFLNGKIHGPAQSERDKKLGMNVVFNQFLFFAVISQLGISTKLMRPRSRMIVRNRWEILII